MIYRFSTKDACDLPDDNALRSSFSLALMAVVGKTVDQWFEDNPTQPDLAGKMKGVRKNCPNPNVFRTWQREREDTVRQKVIPAPVYRVRPLNGIWATAPYLHNGSVPTLWDMLLPAAERPKTFCVGSKEFDPEKVGLKTVSQPVDKCPTGYTLFNADFLGNSNAGHSFQGDFQGKRTSAAGVIGPELNDKQRGALVEYLKSL